MSEERRDQAQEGARRVLSPVRLAVLLLLGALFLVLGGSRADAAEAEPALDEAPRVLRDTLEAADVGPVLAPVVQPVPEVTEPLVEPVVEPVVRPVVEPVVAPLRPTIEQVVAPLVAPPVAQAVAPAAGGGPAGPTPVAHRTAPEGGAVVTADPGATVVEPPADATEQADGDDTAAEAATRGAPASHSASTTGDGGTGAPVPYAVLLTAFAAVLVLAGGVPARRVAPPLAPTFLPPVFPG